ncbi:SDR family NAD(P)-dependent oxidoreductase [Janibacter indicus]|uniref:Oxidoreductase n=1 Tax=Janibacter indicus TaxID=857417 RepID=A0A1L3MHP9_9MICO|nr:MULTISPECIES: SDR family NAD(P)-dependent oxidoreductase [Janibacter]APH01822.1 oxidoreductase [Janibacter indicus]QOK21751.1 SDR family NAD(P)-dependent oxidoreductase [Janibacter indicus]
MSLSPRPKYTPALRGRRVLITGAARGIGAGLADLLTAHGARVALSGLEPELLAEVAQRNHAPWRECDVSDPDAVDRAVEELVTELGGLDVVVANAGIAKQLPIIGGQPDVMEAHLRVNTLGVFYTLRAAGPHITHPGGYALATASLAAAVHLPLLGAYSASKAAVEAIGNTFRQEIKPTGAKVGVAYYSELATDMTSRGFDTVAGKKLTGGGTVSGVAPVEAGLRALERGIAKRSRRIAAPGWVPPVVPLRHVAQRVIELKPMPELEESLAIARTEQVDYTTAQPTTSRKAL